MSLTISKKSAFVMNRALSSIQTFFGQSTWIDFSFGTDGITGRDYVTGHIQNEASEKILVKVSMCPIRTLDGFVSGSVRIEARWHDQLGVTSTNFRVCWRADKKGQPYPSYVSTPWGDTFLKNA